MTQREKLSLQLDKNQVTITLTLADHYAAIEMYEKLLVGAREGWVSIDLETAESTPP